MMVAPLSWMAVLMGWAASARCAGARPNLKQWVYFGTYTDTTGKGIYCASFDPATGRLGQLRLAAATPNPSYFVISPHGRFLYAVNELNAYATSKSGAVSAFAIDARTRGLRLINKVPSRGTVPAYIAFDRSGRYLLVANYGSGSVAVFPRRADGGLGPATAVDQHRGHGANPKRQAGPHAHMVLASPDNRILLSADLGLDQIIVDRFNPTEGTLQRDAAASIALTPGTGPRHFVFSASGTRVYAISEMGSTVFALSYDPATGALHEFQSLSSQPQGKTGTGAEIALSPSGRFLYVSDRGSNRIAWFKVDPQSGSLSWGGDVSSGGRQPRMFQIEPGGRYLWVGNQDSANVVVFHMNPSTGALTPTGLDIKLGRPVCIQFMPAPE